MSTAEAYHYDDMYEWICFLLVTVSLVVNLGSIGIVPVVRSVLDAAGPI